MARKRPSNLLALPVLACLYERPMHPYEMASVMRKRGKHESIKLNYGSLYSVVETLERRGLIEAQETQREGRRPERTIYALTDAGAAMLLDWMRELLSVPVKEYTSFEAALALMPVLPPEEVQDLLEQRCVGLEIEIRQLQATRDVAAEHGLPRLFSVEGEYWLALRETELAWVSALIKEIAAGSLDGLAEWRAFHAARESGEIEQLVRELEQRLNWTHVLDAEGEEGPENDVVNA